MEFYLILKDTKKHCMKRIFTLLGLFLGLTLAASAQYNLVINELDYDNFRPSQDSAEFIELYNNGTAAFDLADFAIVLVNGANSGAAVYNTISLPTYSLGAGSHYVICGNFNGGFVPNCNQQINQTSSVGFIQNGSPDAIAIIHLPDSSIVDALSYEGTVPGYVEGTGVPLANSDTINMSDTVNAPYLGICRFPDGADSNNDSLDFIRACVTPGAANVNTATGCQNLNSVPSISVNNHLVAFPNPAREKVTLIGLPSSNAEWTISILDITGKEVYNRNSYPQNRTLQIDVSDMINGVYILNASSPEHPSFKGCIKLVVRH
ncbi:MAG: hypothetical protein RL021_408 [Bacteroidota bacterium]|jgi:hypothetical protein